MKKLKGKVLLYSPYIDILGGGERHILSILQVFDKRNYSIDIAWNDKSIKHKISQRLNLNFKNLRIIPNFFLKQNKFAKILNTFKYDYFFYVTDGSYFISRARHNYIYAMYPQKSIYNMKFLNRLKLFNYSVFTTSEFAAKYVDRWFGKKPKVIHPYIDEAFFKIRERHGKKEKIILSVGRFFEHLHSKRHDITIRAFRKLKDSDPRFKDFNLIIAGGLKEGEEKESLVKIKNLIKNKKDIKVKTNLSFKDLLALYAKALIYWHAAGYGINEQKEPQKVEHFGITPFEAMAAGCIVFCNNSGGPKQLITDGLNGYLYNTIDELITKTSNVMVKDEKKLLRESYLFAKKNFSYKVFEENVVDFFKI